ncbi:Uncharacterized protein dnm_024930 [Desulfonema magnum]|uniref:Uncharacterized protein n=1 Tax=Desulfonema magnum TaxID=45655 RepID=A0A975BJU6_9BACT|nr:Uncharacterized protein dnm_024930 [Desulfonema magnum]
MHSGKNFRCPEKTFDLMQKTASLYFCTPEKSFDVRKKFSI